MGSADEEGKPGNKGFAGLSKLVSKVDIPAAPALPPAPAPTSPKAAPSPASTSAPAPTKAPDARPATPYNPPVGKQGRGTAWGWLVGICGFIIFMALSSQNGANRSGTGAAPTSAPSTYSAPASTTGPINPGTVKWDSPSVSLVEAMPPLGTDLVLSGTQIRYCLAQEIRLDGEKEAVNESEKHVNQYSQASVDAFNASVNAHNSRIADFNSRCSHYRYKTSDMKGAQPDVESRRLSLLQEGRNRVPGYGRPLAASQASTRVQPNQASPSKTISVTSVALGKSIGPDGRVTFETTAFGRMDTIHAVINSRTTVPNVVVLVHWTYGRGQLVKDDVQTLAGAGDNVTTLYIGKPDGWPVGPYALDLIVNGKSISRTEYFVE